MASTWIRFLHILLFNNINHGWNLYPQASVKTVILLRMNKSEIKSKSERRCNQTTFQQLLPGVEPVSDSPFNLWFTEGVFGTSNLTRKGGDSDKINKRNREARSRRVPLIYTLTCNQHSNRPGKSSWVIRRWQEARDGWGKAGNIALIEQIQNRSDERCSTVRNRCRESTKYGWNR